MFTGWSIARTVALPFLRLASRGLVVDPGKEKALGQEVIDEFGVVTEGVHQPVDALSGGNQQKVIVGRWLQRGPKLLILDEPFRGVDIGARRTIANKASDLAASGTAVMVLTSEVDELLEVADRVIVLVDGSPVLDTYLADSSARGNRPINVPRRLEPSEGNPMDLRTRLQDWLVKYGFIAVTIILFVWFLVSEETFRQPSTLFFDAEVHLGGRHCGARSDVHDGRGRPGPLGGVRGGPRGHHLRDDDGDLQPHRAVFWLYGVGCWSPGGIGQCGADCLDENTRPLSHVGDDVYHHGAEAPARRWPVGVVKDDSAGWNRRTRPVHRGLPRHRPRHDWCGAPPRSVVAGAHRDCLVPADSNQIRPNYVCGSEQTPRRHGYQVCASSGIAPAPTSSPVSSRRLAE